MPEFDGDPLKWQGFWDRYEVSIHSNANIRETGKFNYLKVCLKGEALDAISGLSLNMENYEDAIQLLKNRFGNEQLLISAHMESLLKISKIRSRENIKELRMLYNHVENCIRNLKSLKLDTTGYGSLLIPILKDRLPDEVTMIISRKFGSNIWTLDGVMEFFNDELRAQENCFSPSTSQPPGFSEYNKSRKSGCYTTSGLFSETGKSLCVYCLKEGPARSKCTNVSGVNSRKAMLRRNNRCFICLAMDKGHIAKKCTSSYVCRRCKGGKHHISICVSAPNKPPDKPDENENGNKQDFDILPRDESKQVSTRILFDSGSQRTYVSEKVRNRLGLKTLRSEKVIIKTFGQKETSEVQRLDVVQFKIRKGGHEFICVEASCVPTICCPLTNQKLSRVQALSDFQGLQFADFEHQDTPNLPVGILIGIDYYHVFMTGEIIRSREEPVASGTRVGWVLSGHFGTGSSDIHCLETHLLRSVVEQVEEGGDLRQELQKFWEVESIGSATSDVVSKFEEDIVHNGTRYVVKLPFKPGHDLLPDNFNACEGRLKALKSRLVSKGIYNDYDTIFKDYEKEGIIERVPVEEIAKEAGTTHYLPHRPVIREDKQTTKIRAVFDASCKVNGPSLNQCLYAGPNLIAKIFDVLVRFRFTRIGLLADIKQAFLNVEIASEHRDYLRFLWYNSNADKAKQLFIDF